eukprot:Lithocolla_globosa_v1_NODE_9852_length_661_cov_158.354785.p2 type:complete len:101 gc:universal NODE_9852_length_661_cov_158.354785:301-603(+)
MAVYKVSPETVIVPPKALSITPAVGSAALVDLKNVSVAGLHIILRYTLSEKYWSRSSARQESTKRFNGSWKVSCGATPLLIAPVNIYDGSVKAVLELPFE